jgi:hypothetical protein
MLVRISTCFFLLSAGTLHIIPHCLCNHNHAQPCRQETFKSRSRIACCYAQYPSRIVRVPSSPAYTYCKHLHSYPPTLSLSPCFSVIHHKMGASSRRYGAEKGLTGLTGLRSVLWSRSRRLFWPTRWTKGKLTKRLGAGTAAPLRCENFCRAAVPMSACPCHPSPVVSP